MSWSLLTLTTRDGFRVVQSPQEQFNLVLTELAQQCGVHLPPAARGTYRDVPWKSIPLRVYVVTWVIKPDDTAPEWMLLVILGAQPGATLPVGATLQVRDEQQLLETAYLSDRQQDYLFAQVAGTGAERFWVTISLNNGAAMTFPPFTFEGNFPNL